jgi:hypothetical protein
MKITYLHLIWVGLLSLIPVAFMYSNYRLNLSEEAYEFQRRIIYNFDERIKLDVKYDTYYFAGNSTSNIYLGNNTAARHLLKVDTGLKHSKTIIITPGQDSLTSKGLYRVYLDSNQYLFANGQTRSIFMERLNHWKPKKLNNFIPYFKDVIPLSSGSKIYANVSALTRENSLLKVLSNDSLVENDKIFLKQVDGQFCTSGTIGYNDALRALTYVYKFRNEILMIDTNLRLIKKMKTIDPIDSAKFTVSTIKSTQRKVITNIIGEFNCNKLEEIPFYTIQNHG